MKRLLMLSITLFAAMTVKAEETALKTENDKVLYTLGAAIGQNIADFNLTPAELKLVTLGLKDFVQNSKLKVDVKEYSPKINEFAMARRAVKAEGEKKKSQKFLEAAAKEKGAVKTDSGLIFIPMKEGTGAKPQATDKVKVHYHGTLTDGSVFDSSVQRGTPAEFPLNQVIPCWTEGVQKIKVGGKAKLICPSAIAYGDQGRPPQIPGGAALVFEVELLEISKDK